MRPEKCELWPGFEKKDRGSVTELARYVFDDGVRLLWFAYRREGDNAMNRGKPGIISKSVFVISLALFLGVLVFEGLKAPLRR